MLTLHGERAGDTLWVVGNKATLAALAVLALGVWTGAHTLAFAAGLLVAMSLICRAWSRLALAAVRIKVEFRDDRAFPGDVVNLVMTVENAWPIPLGWLEGEILIPPRLHPVEAITRRALETDHRVIAVLTSLLPFQAASWTWQLRCRYRGRYDVPLIWLTVADPLRLFPRRRSIPLQCALLVYPEIVPLETLGLRSRLPGGDLLMPTVRVDDPIRTIGVRDYRPGDPQRRIHWKASARRPTLQVKVMERTAQLQLALYLGVDDFDHSWVIYRDALFERVVSAVASLANAAVERGGRVSLGISGEEPTYLPSGGGTDHLRDILELLAVVQPRRGRPLASVLEGSAWRVPGGASLAVAVARVDDELRAELSNARRRGLPVAVLHASVDPLEIEEGIEVFEIGRSNDISAVLAEPIQPW
ncbi:MAG: DUF58 domain-containing protein [Chloroflexota bacterium]